MLSLFLSSLHLANGRLLVFLERWDASWRMVSLPESKPTLSVLLSPASFSHTHRCGSGLVSCHLGTDLF